MKTTEPMITDLAMVHIIKPSLDKSYCGISAMDNKIFMSSTNKTFCSDLCKRCVKLYENKFPGGIRYEDGAF